jgi:hypothetical protein
MKFVLLLLSLTVIARGTAAGQPATDLREVRFTGPSAVNELCACLLDLRNDAEAHGRLDFTAEVQSAAAGASVELTARVREGSAHVIGRIDFAGHTRLNDSTLRRAMTIYERDLLDVRQLRRSLTRINDIGVFEPLSLADISIARRDDGVTADLTIRLRERQRRWWSVSGPMLPGIGMLQASVSSRLPPWGRGLFEAATYFVSLNVAGFAKPFLTLQRPVIPGQELLSGFALSPALSPLAMSRHYGLAHLAHRLGPMRDGPANDSLALPVTTDGIETEPLICVPSKARLWWLRSAGTIVGRVALGVM